MKVTKQNTIGVQYDRRCCDASDLGLEPGQFPEQLETDLGNKRPFLRWNQLSDGGWRYIQLLGCLWLTVYND